MGSTGRRISNSETMGWSRIGREARMQIDESIIRLGQKLDVASLIRPTLAWQRRQIGAGGGIADAARYLAVASEAKQLSSQRAGSAASN
jgi:hypothetical protein